MHSKKSIFLKKYLTNAHHICEYIFIGTWEVYALTIKEIRSFTTLSQEEFAKKYKLSPDALEKWECGKKMPSDSMLNFIKFQVAKDYPHIKYFIFKEQQI